MAKKSKRKAEKLRRKAQRAGRPFEVTEDTEFVDAEDVVYRGALLSDGDVEEIVARLTEEPVFDHDVYDASRPRRWSTGQISTGDWAVFDSFTGLRSLAGTEAQALEAARKLEDGWTLENYVWRLPESGAEVMIASAYEGHQFWAMFSEEYGWGVFDRFQRLVHPIADEDHAYEWMDDATRSMAADFNRDPRELDECNDNPDERHWVTLPEWMEHWSDQPEVGESDMREAVSAALEDAQRPVRVLLVSSRGWGWKGIVRELLQYYWNGIGNPPMTILTSGMPHGAEAVAYEFLEAGVHGLTHEVIADDMIRPENVDYAFAFISNASEGASKVVDRLRALEIPVHLIEETSAVIPDRWAGR